MMMNNDVELTNYVEYRVFIQWAKRKGITSLHLEGDSKNAINAINGSVGWLC